MQARPRPAMSSGASSNPGDLWSAEYTIGAEWEMTAVDPRTGDVLYDGAHRLLPVLKTLPCRDFIHDELFANMLEIITPVCATVRDMTRSLRGTYEEVQAVASREGVAFAPYGSHPTLDFSQQIVTPGSERRVRRIDFHGRALRQQNILSMQYHVGMPSGDHAIGAYQALTASLPLFTALSSSSPYWEGVDTGLESARPMAYSGAPYCGQPPLVESWSEYESLYRMLVAEGFGFIGEPKDLHFEVRITHHGTVELRMCDGLATSLETGGIGALVHTLAVQGARRGPQPGGTRHGERRLEGNRFLAMRYGIDARLHTADGDLRTHRQRMPGILARLAPLADELGCLRELEAIPTMIAMGSGARRQRAAVAADRGDIRAAARQGMGELQQDRISMPNLNHLAPFMGRHGAQVRPRVPGGPPAGRELT